MNKQQKETLVGWLFSGPAFVWVGLIVILPVLLVVWTAFFNIYMVNIEEASFVGLDNFRDILIDPNFWIEVKNTFVWCFFNMFFHHLIHSSPISVGRYLPETLLSAIFTQSQKQT